MNASKVRSFFKSIHQNIVDSKLLTDSKKFTSLNMKRCSDYVSSEAHTVNINNMLGKTKQNFKKENVSKLCSSKGLFKTLFPKTMEDFPKFQFASRI